MSERAHFWVRLVGLALILAAQFGPRLWNGASPLPSAPVTAAVLAR